MRSARSGPNRKRRARSRTASSRPPPRPRRKGLSRVGLVALGMIGGWAAASGISLLVWALVPASGSGRLIELDWRADLVGARASAERLNELRLIRSPRLFAIYATLVHMTPDPGPHLLSDRLSPRDLVQRLGRLKTRPSVRVPMPEGFNHFQLAERLEKLGVCSSRAFQHAASDRALLDELGISGPTAEGFLFPASYDFGVDSAPDSVLRTLVREMNHRLDRLDRELGSPLVRLERERGMNRAAVLTLASIVERETGDPAERPQIASVYFNRLSDPEFVPQRTLQSDPTAAYGCLVEHDTIPSCAGFDGRVTPAMLRDATNRYNTYRHPGLPPGPIANPGEAAIAAVLAPARTNYLFFVARGDGRHTFSRTYAEHSLAVEQSGPAKP